ncbi:hypothetical protein CDCA_CDCA03G1057 [Cyanidium caldarium]|uniref:tRNA-binding domain-containing protein n=1 Tax=Cyanidium caldarium TaxID=2771 RepID=A0AAV9IRQ9_CYACA|nr:hypothetical protein CDCA_CDCA03G1057 [Cyanidium caldarium]
MALVPADAYTDWITLCEAISECDEETGGQRLVEVGRAAVPSTSVLWGGAGGSERRKFVESLAGNLVEHAGDMNGFVESVLVPVLSKGERTFLCGAAVSAVDVLLARAITEVMRGRAVSADERELWRWFDLMQNLLARYGKRENVQLVPVPASFEGRENLIEAEEQAERQRQQKTDKEAEQLVEAEAQTERQRQKKADKEAKKLARKLNTAADITAERSDLSRVDIRVGEIVSARPHPDADALYVEEIDLGPELGRRTVCSGLRRHIPDAQQLLGPCVVVANLKPVNMRGIASQAMVLCATSSDGATVELVQPPPNAAPGARVYFPGTDADERAVPDAVLPPKKKIFERVAEHLHTADDASCEARYDDRPFTTREGTCRAPTVRNGTIR